MCVRCDCAQQLIHKDVISGGMAPPCPSMCTHCTSISMFMGQYECRAGNGSSHSYEGQFVSCKCNEAQLLEWRVTAASHSTLEVILSPSMWLLLTLRPAWQIKSGAPSTVGPLCCGLSPGCRGSCNGWHWGFILPCSDSRNTWERGCT